MKKPFYQDSQITEYCGHTPDVLKELPAESVHMVITSPPYFGLRSYQIEPQIWDDPNDENTKDCTHLTLHAGRCLKCGYCEHEWGENLSTGSKGHPGDKSTLIGTQTADIPKAAQSQGQFCQKCGSWKGDLGNEPSIDLYLSHLVQVFKEVKRVLRSDGVLFLNIGDSYATHASKRSGQFGKEIKEGFDDVFTRRKTPAKELGLKEKDLCMIPARIALALQADGWWLRSDIIWQKLSCMPESLSGWRWERHQIKIKAQEKGKQQRRQALGGRDAVDGVFLGGAEYENCSGCPKCDPNGGYVLRKGSWRPTSSHEYVFMFAKSEKYFCDGEAVRETNSPGSIERFGIKEEGQTAKWNTSNNKRDGRLDGTKSNEGFRNYVPIGRNLRSVLTIDDTLNEFLKYCHETFGWDVESAVEAFIDGQDDLKDVFTINPEATSQKHFAAFPSKLCEIAIKCSTSEKGCCPKCQAPWVRVVEKTKSYESNAGKAASKSGIYNLSDSGSPRTDVDRPEHDIRFGPCVQSKTIEWRPSCTCGTEHPIPQEELNADPTLLDDFEIKPYPPIPCTVLDPFSGTVAARL